MSLYCFGKVIPFSIKEELKQCVPIDSVGHLYVGDIDSGDLEVFSEIDALKRAGTTFRYVDEKGDSSATEMWIKASEVANEFSEAERDSFDRKYSDAMKSTALGGFVWNLLQCSDIEYGAIALVDGGVETICHTTPEKCWAHFLQVIPKPWDCHDNPLLVWSHRL